MVTQPDLPVQGMTPSRRDWPLWLACAALLLMIVLACLEMVLRPAMGRGVDNAPVLIQHLGLVMTMFGAVAAAQHGHLISLGQGLATPGATGWRRALAGAVAVASAAVGGMLAAAANTSRVV